MKRKATPVELERLAAVRSLPCLACQMFGVYRQPFPTEAHHQNLGGRAGQKRLGHNYTIPLCQWHHTGRVTPGVDAVTMRALYGPSLARHSRAFREHFGSDGYLLKLTNAMIEQGKAA